MKRTNAIVLSSSALFETKIKVDLLTENFGLISLYWSITLKKRMVIIRSLTN